MNRSLPHKCLHFLFAAALLLIAPERLPAQDAAIEAGENAMKATAEAVGDMTDPMTATFQKVWENMLSRLPYLVGGVLVVLLTAVAAFVLRRIVRRMLVKSELRVSLKDLMERFTMIGVWLAGLLLTAMVMLPDMTISKAIGGLGIASIAIGFAFKDIFENFFAGILLLWHFPVENGDYIECEGISGMLEEITIRMSMIRLTTGELIVVPNSFLYKNPVKVDTNRPVIRVSIIAGVAYGEDVAGAVKVIEAAVQSCHSVDANNPVQVFPQAFGSSSIDIEVAWWTGSEPVEVRASRGEVVTAIKKALDEAGIEIPFPYRTLTFKQPLDTRILEKVG